MKHASLFSVVFALTAFAQIAHADLSAELARLPKEEREKYEPHECGKSKAPLFKDEEILEVDLAADFSRFNNNGASVRGVVRVGDTTLPVFLQPRGNSRLRHCNFKPIRMAFLNPAVKTKIEQAVGSGVGVAAEEYFKKYIEELNSFPAQEAETATKQDDNFFDKIGNDVKIVTHCGKSDWGPIGGEDVATQDRRFLMEYYTYKILATLKTTTLQVRLARFNYRDGNGKLIETRYGFFRENAGSTAKRCELLGEQDVERMAKTANWVSKIQAYAISHLIFSRDFSFERDGDGHNSQAIFQQSADGRAETHYIPYDFDLTGVINPEYGKNRGLSLEENARYAIDKLQESASAAKENKFAVLLQVDNWLSNEIKMREVIETSVLSAEAKARLMDWHRITFESLKSYRAELNREN